MRLGRVSPSVRFFVHTSMCPSIHASVGLPVLVMPHVFVIPRSLLFLLCRMFLFFLLVMPYVFVIPEFFFFVVFVVPRFFFFFVVFVVFVIPRFFVVFVEEC